VPAAGFRVYGELNDFLPEGKRGRPFREEFASHETVKHVLETIGIPHPEIELLLINGESSSFGERLHDGDWVSAYPPFRRLDIREVTQVQTLPEGKLKFVLDSHLGTLAKNLRLLGFDTRYRNDYSDPELSEISAREGRILLTRDLGLLKRKQVRWGYLIREDDPWQQTRSVVLRYNLEAELEPFSRCVRCNGRLDKVEKDEVLDQLEPLTRKYYQNFSQCRECGQVYWKGSHFSELSQRIEAASHPKCEKYHNF
jgi:uncharacterized protein with PIN domain